jgi:hypothetical protein
VTDDRRTRIALWVAVPLVILLFAAGWILAAVLGAF